MPAIAQQSVRGGHVCVHVSPSAHPCANVREPRGRASSYGKAPSTRDEGGREQVLVLASAPSRFWRLTSERAGKGHFRLRGPAQDPNVPVSAPREGSPGGQLCGPRSLGLWPLPRPLPPSQVRSSQADLTSNSAGHGRSPPPRPWPPPTTTAPHRAPRGRSGPSTVHLAGLPRLSGRGRSPCLCTLHPPPPSPSSRGSARSSGSIPSSVRQSPSPARGSNIDSSRAAVLHLAPSTPGPRSPSTQGPPPCPRGQPRGLPCPLDGRVPI